ncbi:hypothetical protein B5V02_25055 [Mesorhizobium kowhaii]|uniref:Uncharacterized protein n=1 Tax=Mesorhizobium kowhaii TaxID=1300272 RepID=A0A2W7C0S2_9HYPH|nr:hypothetical protein B5V02_25055 [Mesorhizobium kowhaii]
MRLDWIILPVMVWAKVEGFVAGRTGSTAKTKADGFGPNQPGPSRFPSAGTRGVEPLERWNPIALRASPTGLPRRSGNRMIQSNLISL